MDSTDIDPNSLLQAQDLNTSINQSLQPLAGVFIAFTILSVVLTIAIVIVWILSLIRRRKVQNAIFDIQATLHEMNERDKARSAVPRPKPEATLANADTTASAADSMTA